MKPEQIIQSTLNSPEDFIRECDESYQGKIKDLVNGIMENAAERPIILISGPSGSGKTTSARLTEHMLDALGCETHVLSLDNYFHPLTPEEKELFAENKLDLESPLRLDAEFLNHQLSELHKGNEVEIPRFDFINNTRRSSGEKLQLKKNELIILEGIHALNPDVIDADDYTMRVYVSVRTRVELSGGRLLHPSKVRLARRMIRDARTRGRSHQGTVDLYDSVERGENLYIMPYKHRAHYDIDTFFPCELGIHKNFLPSSMPEVEKKYPWISDLFEAMSLLPAIDPDLVPKASLLREFIGGGMFED
ncbi:MAG: nucleoside kinase [Clostridia bacterium]|nr:nucleoside kinase [Clostridia bacterium]